MTFKSSLRLLVNAFHHPGLSGRLMPLAVQRNLDFARRSRSSVNSDEKLAQSAIPENRLRPSPTLRILLADDCIIKQMMTQAVLARWSIHLHSAVDGRDEIHQALSTRFDMVLIAVELPECDGFEVATFIRAYESGNGLTRMPIVAYSTSPRVRDLDGMAKAGIDDVLAKP